MGGETLLGFSKFLWPVRNCCVCSFLVFYFTLCPEILDVLGKYRYCEFFRIVSLNKLSYDLANHMSNDSSKPLK